MNLCGKMFIVFGAELLEVVVLGLLLTPLNVIVLSHVRVMETMGLVPKETVSRT